MSNYALIPTTIMPFLFIKNEESPQLSYSPKIEIKKRIKQKERWCYSCAFPKEGLNVTKKKKKKRVLILFTKQKKRVLILEFTFCYL